MHTLLGVRDGCAARRFFQDVVARLGEHLAVQFFVVHWVFLGLHFLHIDSITGEMGVVIFRGTQGALRLQSQRSVFSAFCAICIGTKMPAIGRHRHLPTRANAMAANFTPVAAIPCFNLSTSSYAVCHHPAALHSVALVLLPPRRWLSFLH